jgi:hypothetical protein
MRSGTPTPPLPEFELNDEALPASLRELVRVLGLSGTLRLLAMAQGGRVIVPKKPKPDDPRCTALGEETYLRLIAEYKGEAIDVPKADAFLRQIRHQQVSFYRAAGLTMDQIALHTGYSKRWVIDILGGHADGRDTQTIDMFEPAQIVKPSHSRRAANQPKLPKLPSFSAHDPFGMTRQRA